MRIIQIIDSLEAAGAERMAVNYANALAERIDFSGLVVTRKQGPLKSQLDCNVPYLFLDKKSILDLRALSKLRKFVVQNKVEMVHAHGTSFFTAIALKWTYPKIKIIWHEHYGGRVNQSSIDNLVLLFFSFFFASIFVVNHQLEIWVKKRLFTKEIFYIPNFAVSDKNEARVTILKGIKGKRIVCLANLKNPKNHNAILGAFEELKLYDLGWSLHLIGKDYKDDYSKDLKSFIDVKGLGENIFIYDSQNDIQHILSQATVGILCSTAEGFPVTLLEYGLARLSVVSTNVGSCSEIIKDNFSGLLFDPLDVVQLQQQLQKLILDKQLRANFALHLHKLVLEEYSEERVIQLLISKYNLL